MEKQHELSEKAKSSILMLLFGLFSLFPTSAAAQQLRFALYSFHKVFTSMPQYAVMQKSLADLQSQYDDEMKRAENEFNNKYEEFLLLQRSLATPIRLKRQAELQELMQKNIAFRDQARQLLDAARHDAEQPLRQQISDVVRQLGAEGGYAFVLNTDGDACPYFDAALGEDITETVIQALNAK